MHTIRLLDMAAEILEQGILQVRRPNRAHLLSIRRGDLEYEALMTEATEKLARIEQLYPNSPLPEQPGIDWIERMLVETRNAWYENTSL